jgi:hypothetical protein
MHPVNEVFTQPPSYNEYPLLHKMQLAIWPSDWIQFSSLYLTASGIVWQSNVPFLGTNM